MTQRNLHEENRLSWNAATKQHNTHRGDQAGFLQAGGSTLFPEEIALLGEVRGKTLLHLQCNSGMDTLSIAKHLGADVTGVDISDEAIETAKRISAESGVAGTFVRSDIYDWFDSNDQQFDVVFQSYGVLCWLSDIGSWGRGVADALKPGGHYVLVEFHPFMGILDDNDWSIMLDYMSGTHYQWDGVGDYVGEMSGNEVDTGMPAPHTGESFQNPHQSNEFSWGLGEVVMALVNAGLTLKMLNEYPFSNGYKPFADMVEGEGRRRYPPADKPQNLPLMFGIVAQK